MALHCFFAVYQGLRFQWWVVVEPGINVIDVSEKLRRIFMKKWISCSRTAVVILALFASLAYGGESKVQTRGLCDGTWASVSGSGYPGCNDYVVSWSGSWSVGGGANGAYLQYFVNGVLYQTESKSGTSGSWSFSDDVSCNDYVVSVDIYPKVGGTVCWTHGDSIDDFFEGCSDTDVSLTCHDVGNYVKAYGSYTGSSGPYTSQWDTGSGWVNGPPGTLVVPCPPSGVIKFRVLDKENCPTTASCYCGEEPPW